MPRRGNKRKKTRTHVNQEEVTNMQTALASKTSVDAKIPHSAVFQRGKIIPEVSELMHDIREIMRPYTALNLKDIRVKKKSASLAEYSKQLTGPLGVTHLLAINQNSSRVHLRIARTPAGPTLMFNVKRFSLSRQVKAVQRRPFMCGPKAMMHPPIVVTKNFGDNDAPPHVKLMRITFQKMFPAVNVAAVKLSDVRRVVLFNLIKEKDKDGNLGEVVEVRHYAIKATPVGVDRKVRKVVRRGNLPDLSKLDDISQYIAGNFAGRTVSNTPGDVSESEAEDEATHVVLSQKYTGKGNDKSQKSALKLVELGPRMRLKLMKVDKGLGPDSEVMYHAYIKKSASEINAQKKKLNETALLKKRRREEQEANVAAKKAALEKKKAAKKERREEREHEAMESLKRRNGTDDYRSSSEDDREGNRDEDNSENSKETDSFLEDDKHWG